MTEISAAEKQQQQQQQQQQLREKVSDLCDFFENSVSDSMKKYILGGTNVNRYIKQTSKYVVYINNILSLAFVFAHGCLKCDINDEAPVSEKASKQSSLRIINSLKKAYAQYPVTSELIQFVLSDIQFEMYQGPKASELYAIFENLCTFSSKEFSLSKYYKIIAEWRAAPSRFNMNSNELAGMFIELLENMEFIANYDLCADEDGQFSFCTKRSTSFGKKKKFSKVPVKYNFYDDSKSRDMYSLYSIEKIEDDDSGKLRLRYVTGDGFKTMSFVVSEELPDESEAATETYIEGDAEDYYYEIIGEGWDDDSEEQDSKKNGNFIDQVHAINYKYIKNLALAISDAISIKGSKEALYKAYHIRHRDVFEKITSPKDIQEQKVDWDGIIVMLLIESSPTSVLETLFRAVPQTFIEVALNLCKRIDNPDMPIYGLNEDELDLKVKDIMQSKLIMGESGGFGKIPATESNNRLYARAASLLIISSISSVVENDTVEKTICGGNIYDNITLLNKMRVDTAISPEQKCKYVCIILGETFKHLICFYTGLISYGEIKAKFDAESCNSFFSESKIAFYQKKLQNAFMNAAKAEARALKPYNCAEHKDMIVLMNRFIEFCENCSSSSKSGSPNGHKLYFALGKHELLNINEFKNYALGYTDSLPEINNDNVDEWISFALDVLRYLRNGSFKNRTASPFDAIYPFAAVYNRGNENYDGYKTVTFTLYIDSDGDDKADKEYINVLTEFSYDLSNVFYCLPNKLRSNKKWWIDPVLINFKDFNEIFNDDEEENKGE